MVITQELFDNSRLHTKTKEPQSMYAIMCECHQEGWSFEMYSAWMCQFYSEEGLEKFLRPLWEAL